MLASGQCHDVSIGITHHKVNSCFDVRAATLSKVFRSAAEDLAKQFVAVLASRRSIESPLH